MRTPLAVVLAAAAVIVGLQLHHTPESPPAATQVDPQIQRLFTPDTRADSGVVCAPFMNMLHIYPCPMVLV